MEAPSVRFLAKKAYFSTLPEQRYAFFPGKTAKMLRPAA
jgi:hypothetical protein